MKIKDFVKMWKDDNAVEDIILVETREHDDGTSDLLYHVLYQYTRGGNGRHEALRVRISKDEEVLSHDIFNLHGEQWGQENAQLDPNNNYMMQISSWFTTWSTAYTGSGTGGVALSITVNSGSSVVAYY